jgi:hypothetical protein
MTKSNVRIDMRAKELIKKDPYLQMRDCQV